MTASRIRGQRRALELVRQVITDGCRNMSMLAHRAMLPLELEDIREGTCGAAAGVRGKVRAL